MESTAPRSHLLLWAIGAWLTPALAAEAMGWSGIWGGGGAFLDYLIPIPVAGGALHVPSFVVALVVVAMHPKLDPRMAAILRGASLGAALVGLVELVDVDRVALSWTTDLPLRRIPWEANAFGLFLLCDGLWAFGWTLWRAGRPSRIAVVAPIAVVLPALALLHAISTSERIDQPFVRGGQAPGPDRGDETIFLFTTLSVDAPGFREEARAAVDRLIASPEYNATVEDMAIHFTDSLDAARRHDPARILSTLCLYEDGTADRWLPGRGDCFSDHRSFTERFDAVYGAEPSGVPREVRGYRALRAVCEDVVLPEERDPRQHLGRDRCDELDSSLARLRTRYSDEALAELLAAP